MVIKMPITYDPTSNKIVVLGGTETTPYSFEDLYNADKNGALILVERTGVTEPDAEPVSNTYLLRPADDRVLGGSKHDLWIEVLNWSGLTEAVIRLIGKDEGGNDQTEDITVTGDGVYYSSKLWTELTETQVVSVNGSGSFDYRLVQGRWGVVWKIGENEYFIDANVDVGDYSTPTYFAHENFAVKIGTYDNRRDFNMKIANVRFVRGRIEIHEHNPCAWRGNLVFEHCVVRRTVRTYVATSVNTELTARDCYFDVNKFYIGSGSHYILERCWIDSNLDISHSQVELPKSVLYNHQMWIAGEITLVEVEVINPRTIVYELVSSGSKLYLRDSWFDLSRLKHRQTDNETYVQWSFHIRVTDKEGNPIEGADVYLYDKDGNEVLHEVTDINGEIPLHYITQYKITGAGTGSELTVEDFNPYTLIIEKFGYTKYEAKIVIDRPIRNVPIVLEALYTYDELLEQVKTIRKILSNNWEIKDNKLIIYDDDGVTPLLTFNLYDKLGNPTELNVYKRVKQE